MEASKAKWVIIQIPNAMEDIPDSREDRRRNKAKQKNKWCKNAQKKRNKGKDRQDEWQDTGLMEWNTYQMVEETAEGEERKSGHQKG